MEWIIFIGIAYLILKGIFGESNPPKPPAQKPKKTTSVRTTTTPRKRTKVKAKIPVSRKPVRKINHNIPTPHTRSNWKSFQQTIHKNNITELYHFTDKSNIESIRANGGLFSWKYMSGKKIRIPKPGGDGFSRQLDIRKSLQDYVRLSFNTNHPMMYVAQRDGRINDPIILEIDPKVVYWVSTKFSNINAADNLAQIGVGFSDFENINFEIASSNNWIDQTQKKLFQAEVLVKTHIPLSLIKNLNKPPTHYSTNIWKDDDDLTF